MGMIKRLVGPITIALVSALVTAAAAEPATTVAFGPDLTVSKAHRGDPLAGDSAEYILTVTNGGDAPTVAAVTLADQVPAGLAAEAISGEGWNCDLATVSCRRSDSLAPKASFPAVTVTVSVAINPPERVINGATVSGGGESPGATANNSASDPTAIRKPALPERSKHNIFRIRKVTVRGDGTVLIKVAIPAAGRLIADDASKRGLIRRKVRKVRKVNKTRVVTLRVRANHKLRRRIRRRGRSRKVRIRVAFKARGNPSKVAVISTVRRVTFRIKQAGNRRTVREAWRLKRKTRRK